MTTGNAREVLVAELLGDTGRMLDRIDAVVPDLEAAAQRIEEVSAAMPKATKAVIDLYTAKVSETGDAAAKNAIVAVNRSTKAIFHAQTAELRNTAKEIFDRQVTPPLLELTGQLHAAIRQSREDPWNRWFTYVATAMVGMLLPIVLPFLISLASPSAANASSSAPVPECAQPAPTSGDAAQAAAASSLQSSKARARR